jgi:hypothetical protein
MIEANPSSAAVDAAALIERIEACRHCESACNELLSAIYWKTVDLYP